VRGYRAEPRRQAIPFNTIVRQLVAYLDTNRLLPDTQSGFWRGFSTETGSIRVLSDLLDAVDRDEFAALILLDLSATFDTVDHDILLEDYGSPSVYITPPSGGSDHTWPVDDNILAAAAHTLPPLTLSAACFPSPRPYSGTHCRWMFSHPLHFRSFASV